MTEKEFLIQLRKNQVVNIAVRNGDGEYHTDEGTIHHDFDTEFFDYRYMDFSQMRKLLTDNAEFILSLPK